MQNVSNTSLPDILYSSLLYIYLKISKIINKIFIINLIENPIIESKVILLRYSSKSENELKFLSTKHKSKNFKISSKNSSLNLIFPYK